jgi:lactobin A/cerein 7B family class IIb bacteriocin
MLEDLNHDELKEVNGGSVTAAAVGCALLGVGTGVILGAALAVGVCYLVRKLV